MKSIGELKNANLSKCKFEDIFEIYEDITPEVKSCLDKYLIQFIKPKSDCIVCGNNLRGITADVVDNGKCGECGYPGVKEHKVSCDGNIKVFETFVLQIHPSEMRG